MTDRLVVKCTSGGEAAERCNQAFTVAATALSSGVAVSLWLTGEAAWLGVPGRAALVALPLAVPLEDLLASVLDAGTVTVCSQCAARRSMGEDDVLPGVRIAGSALFVEEILTPGTQALVY